MSMTSGYDALDELYERLRGQENARRAGGITPEAIRAARGGVVDGHGRECHVVDENAAGGDSEPLTGIPRDTRERIEADLEALTKHWHDYDGDFMKIYSSVAYAQVKELLDRQAALTKREACAYCDYKDANKRQAHKIRQVCKCLEDSHEREKELHRKVDELQAELDALRPKRTVEDVLRDFQQDTLTSQGEYSGEVIDADEWKRQLERDVREFADELRELMEVDDD